MGDYSNNWGFLFFFYFFPNCYLIEILIWSPVQQWMIKWGFVGVVQIRHLWFFFFVCFFPPPGQSCDSGTFSIKRSPLKKKTKKKRENYRIFWIKLYLHQKRLLCCKLITCLKLLYALELLDDVKRFGRWYINFLAEGWDECLFYWKLVDIDIFHYIFCCVQSAINLYYRGACSFDILILTLDFPESRWIVGGYYYTSNQRIWSIQAVITPFLKQIFITIQLEILEFSFFFFCIYAYFFPPVAWCSSLIELEWMWL